MRRACIAGSGLLIVALSIAGPTLAAECTDDAFAALNSETTRIMAEVVTEGTVVAQSPASGGRRTQRFLPRDRQHQRQHQLRGVAAVRGKLERKTERVRKRWAGRLHRPRKPGRGA